ncbi:MAG: lytic transglycosylase domain-containing protein [Flavobacteriia bacterium]|nr:MAG: lytic transglycosylase domain-containing protein [Flavobacteriia bacterium]
MKNAPLILTVAGLALIFVFFINSINHPDNNPSKNTSDLYEIKALKIPDNLSFCGEKVPLNKNDVHERIDRELLVNTYWQSNGLLFLKRANKYFPIIEPILRKNSIPDDFKYLALIESGLQNITSPAGAKGFWQLMPKTAIEYGLEVNNNVDERYNLEKSTEAACKYLLEAHEKFGNWTLAAAAYNAGMSGIDKQIVRQKVSDYYDLLLGDETSRYVPRIVAVKEILNHPSKYGFIFDKEVLYRMMPTREVKVDTAITNLADFAKDQNINYKELKILNPWLRENKLNNKTRKLYYIKLPR